MRNAPVASLTNRNGSQASSDAPRPTDPYIGLRFWVQIDEVHVASFKECSGLKIETEVYEYAEGGLNTYTHKLPVRVKYQNITLKRGLDPGQDLLRWYTDAMTGKIKRQNVSIVVYDYQGKTEVERWNLIQAFPVKWSGPDLKADAGAIAVETLEFVHHGLLLDSRPGKP